MTKCEQTITQTFSADGSSITISINVHLPFSLARKEVAPQPRGHLTTRRQLPTASTNAYRHAGDSCIAGTLVFRGRLLEFSPS
jgi:hypothetical protein